MGITIHLWVIYKWGHYINILLHKSGWFFECHYHYLTWMYFDVIHVCTVYILLCTLYILCMDVLWCHPFVCFCSPSHFLRCQTSSSIFACNAFVFVHVNYVIVVHNYMCWHVESVLSISNFLCVKFIAVFVIWFNQLNRHRIHFAGIHYIRNNE